MKCLVGLREQGLDVIGPVEDVLAAALLVRGWRCVAHEHWDGHDAEGGVHYLA